MNVVWTQALACLVVGFGCLALGGVALAYLLVLRGRTRAKTPEELADRINRFNRLEILEPRGVASGKGVRREASFGIDSLRNTAKRGEWGIFWAWPVVYSGFGFGLLFIAAAASSYFQQPVFAIAAALGCVPFGLFGWFCAWAALYTNLDLGTDDS
jgi:hypothetical protein